MSDRKLRLVVFLAVAAVVFGAYFVSVAPTASFWDCGEFEAVCYIMGVPHPPGTPLFVAIGRLFSLIPLSREIAFRINMIPVTFGAVSSGLIYLLIVKLISIYAPPEKERLRWLRHAAGIFGALCCAFALSIWDNSVEAEVYGPCMVVAASVLYMALVWRDRIRAGTGDNRLILAAIFLLFLSTGIHFTALLPVFAVLIFALIVDRESVLHLRIFELIAGYLVILTVQEMGFKVATVAAAVLMLAAAFSGIRLMERSRRSLGVMCGLGLLFMTFVIAYAFAGNGILDDTVLFLASPTVAFVERWTHSPALVVAFVLAFGGYLYWLHRQGRLSARYVGMMLAVVLLAGTVQFIMFVRAKTNPSINEVDPSHWRDFVSVLKREQYDPMKLFPRKTQFLTEDDWRLNQNVRFSLPVAFYEQVKFYVRYFFWQWAGEQNFDIFRRVSWPAVFGLVPTLLGLWGMLVLFRRDKRAFLLIVTAFLVASLGLIVYLNLKYSPSDPRPQLQFREVRERDYFYAFSFVFYTLFIGVGAFAFLRTVAGAFRSAKLPSYAVSGALVALGLVPAALNYQAVTRRGDWIPAEYGYNMLVSCPGEHAVLFTNGDNDTFPLWFMQTVPDRIAGYDPNFGKNVMVANLSLINTPWYCRQMKRWGAPISFTEDEIDRLPQAFLGSDGRTFLLKDVMIRDIVATSAGVKLRWPDDYGSTAAEFNARVFGPGYRPQTPVYFATTVSRADLVDVESHLRLEGLVNRVVPDSGEDMVDGATTRHLLYDVYVMKSMTDRGVTKDNNTRGMLINYAASYLALAGEDQLAGRNADAEKALADALRFDLDRDRKAPLYYHASVFATLAGHYDNALAYLDSLDKLGVKDPELVLRRGFAWQGKGDFEKAAAAYQQALDADPSRPEPVEALYRLYLDELHDTAKARVVLEDWLRRQPGDTVAQRVLKEIS